jgi:hypothetical protein
MILYNIAFRRKLYHVPRMAHDHRTHDLVERLALGATFACLAHCVLLPVAIAALPAMASVVPIPDSVHIALLLLAVPSTGYALLIGYRLHRVLAPVLCGTFGLIFLALGAITWGRTPLEIPATILGSLAIAAAHLTNWHLRRTA